MRLLGVDLGTVRIGLAVAETEPFVAGPRPPLAASGTLKRDAGAIAALARREEADRVVLGLPLAFSPTGEREESRVSRAARLLARELEALGETVAFADEAFTSAAAEGAMRDAGLSIAESRRKVDGEAACRILETYWETERRADANAG